MLHLKVAQWDRCSPSQCWGIPKRKGLETQKGTSEELRPGSSLDQGHTVRLVSGLPRSLFYCQKQEMWQSYCRSRRAHLVSPANSNWVAGGHCLVPESTPSGPTGKWSWSNYWYLEESTIPTSTVCYIKLHTNPILDTLSSFKGKCRRNLKIQHL